jgi:hypothetical protein
MAVLDFNTINNYFDLSMNQSNKKSVKKLITYLKDNPLIGTGNEMSNLLTNYLPINNAQTTYEKVEYRDEEHHKLKSINRIINIIYYCGVVVLLLLLYTENNLLINERYPLYIFLILLPHLYPWIYKFTGKLWGFIYPVFDYTGPKNAFIDINPIKNTYDI